MAAGTPRFGPKLDLDVHKSHMKNFDVEMYRFADDKRGMDRCVNMLHLGVDLDAARPETNRIVRFMRKQGYKAKRKTGLSLSNDGEMFLTCSDADMLILGSDKARDESARYIMRCSVSGWFGIVPYWDMLWYGTDYNPKPPVEWFEQSHATPEILPQFSDHKFAPDAVCLAHAHIRRRYNRAALSGVYIDMAREIEGYMNELVGWKRNESFAAKIKRFKRKVKDDGHAGIDSHLFFESLGVLRHSRNIGAHLTRGIPQKKVDEDLDLFEKLTEKFEGLVRGYGRMFLPPVPGSEADSHLRSNWECRLTHMAMTWLAEYPNSPAS